MNFPAPGVEPGHSHFECQHLVKYSKQYFNDQYLLCSYFDLLQFHCVLIGVLSFYFLQRGRTACNAERCISHSNSVCLSVTCWYPTQMNKDRIMQSSLWGSKNTLVLTRVGLCMEVRSGNWTITDKQQQKATENITHRDDVPC